MSDQIYKMIELTGTSTTSTDDAIRNAVARAGKTLHELRWFQVLETRGALKDGKVTQWQVVLKVAFKLDE